RGQRLAAGREGNRLDTAPVSLELADLLAGGHVPDAHRQVRPAHRQRPAVRREGHTDRPTGPTVAAREALDADRSECHPRAVAPRLVGDDLGELALLLAGGDLPERDGMVIVLRRHGPAVRREGETGDGTGRFDLAQLLAGRRVEEDKRVAALAATGDR